MGMDVDPARGDEKAVGVDHPPRSTGLAADRGDLSRSIATSPVNAGAPLPSTIVPPLMTMSCIPDPPARCSLEHAALSARGAMPKEQD